MLLTPEQATAKWVFLHKAAFPTENAHSCRNISFAAENAHCRKLLEITGLSKKGLTSPMMSESPNNRKWDTAKRGTARICSWTRVGWNVAFRERGQGLSLFDVSNVRLIVLEAVLDRNPPLQGPPPYGYSVNRCWSASEVLRHATRADFDIAGVNLVIGEICSVLTVLRQTDSMSAVRITKVSAVISALTLSTSTDDLVLILLAFWDSNRAILLRFDIVEIAILHFRHLKTKVYTKSRLSAADQVP